MFASRESKEEEPQQRQQPQQQRNTTTNIRRTDTDTKDPCTDCRLFVVWCFFLLLLLLSPPPLMLLLLWLQVPAEAVNCKLAVSPRPLTVVLQPTVLSRGSETLTEKVNGTSGYLSRSLGSTRSLGHCTHSPFDLFLLPNTMQQHHATTPCNNNIQQQHPTTTYKDGGAPCGQGQRRETRWVVVDGG
jgi:hypothetical protein